VLPFGFSRMVTETVARPSMMVEPRINELRASCARGGLSAAGTGQTSRLQVAARVGLGRPVSTKRRSSVVAGIQWMRIPKKIHAPTTGVAKRTSSPNAVATNAKTTPH
jgi:hypothetical protein